jgi:hypothetical protein
VESALPGYAAFLLSANPQLSVISPCILYAVSCNLSESDLVNQYDLLAHGKALADTPLADGEDVADDEASGEADVDEIEEVASSAASKATLRLKKWHDRRAPNLGLSAGRGRAVPLIDNLHRVMRLWRAGDVNAVDDYLRSEALLANPLFHQVLQALIELEGSGNGDRALLETISNHLSGRGHRPASNQSALF